jgi:hypothetical protein
MNLPNEKIYLADSKMHLMDKNLKKEIALWAWKYRFLIEMKCKLM